LESEEAQKVSQRDGIIIDTGGGVIERNENVAALETNGCLFWLKASVDIIVSRISSGSERPALTPDKTFTDEVAQVLAQRTIKYQRAARYEIATDELTPEQVTDTIVAIWEKRCKTHSSD